MANKLVIPILGDLHWGAVPADRLEAELGRTLIPWLESNHFDAFVQAGDWFDKRLILDSDDSKASNRFVVRICQICQARGAPFRIIQGGIAHDGLQLENFRALETEYSCFRVISSAQHETLLPGFDVLWLPEQYPTDYGDFYNQFLFDEDGDALVYDAILFHGEVDVAAGWSAAIEGERHYGGTPCHASTMLLEHSSGPVWGGHIHNRFRYQKRLGYVGSFTRWCQGEEDAKGFDVLTLTEKAAGGWKVEARTVENEGIPRYETVLAVELLSLADPVDAMVARIRERAEGLARLRVKMAGFQLGVEEMAILRAALVEDRRIDLMLGASAVTRMAELEESEDVVAAEQEAREHRMSYLRDPNMPGDARLLRYLHDRQPERADITIEEVRELTAPLV